MPKLPIVSGKEVVKILTRIGYTLDRQKGSHMILIKNGRRSIPVPNHKPISYRIVESIIKQAEITKEDFIKLYKNK